MSATKNSGKVRKVICLKKDDSLTKKRPIICGFAVFGPSGFNTTYDPKAVNIAIPDPLAKHDNLYLNAFSPNNAPVGFKDLDLQAY